MDSSKLAGSILQLLGIAIVIILLANGKQLAAAIVGLIFLIVRGIIYNSE